VEVDHVSERSADEEKAQNTSEEACSVRGGSVLVIKEEAVDRNYVAGMVRETLISLVAAWAMSTVHGASFACAFVAFRLVQICVCRVLQLKVCAC
jgi:hypothetical protein